VTRRTRLSLAFAAALVTAAVIILVVALLTHGAARTPPPVRAQAGQSARQSARDACRDMADVQQLTRQNAAATRVLRYLRIAAADSGAAVARDSTWRSLESGIVALQQSITTNNGALAGTGIAIVRDQCRRTGLDLAHRAG